MFILGIETSCDETAAAVVKDGREILSNIVYSQIKLHRKTGGVVPEVAAREHVVKIIPVLENAIKKAKIGLADIDAIAVTQGPGLLSSLLIGVNVAMTLAAVLKKPLVPVNHIEGHIYANLLENPGLLAHSRDQFGPHIARPNVPNMCGFAMAAVLTVSGGHNELLLWKNHGEYKFLGATLDDAAGEAFDKVARLLGLGYPGGPEIEKAAKRGDPNKYPLPRPWLTPNSWDFSFSGLKTAVLRLVMQQSGDLAPRGAQNRPTLNPQFISDVAASFQESVCEVLATKLVNAAKKYRVREILLAGGVSANLRLREWVKKLASDLVPQSPILVPRPSLCTDNAAMIAGAGYFKFRKNPTHYKKWQPIIADPNLEIKPW